ncbi:hypothetical protein KUTeg_024355 [Tegillarca granosa]|uniref:Mitochondria-eating protein n=1 Tax=Tegillarca granosa TaxID=220873 RepID=A0ABQ9E159_TEGGR|nr:hypothetical protein KUTeg_024355 [Tegillarca granosa]
MGLSPSKRRIKEKPEKNQEKHQKRNKEDQKNSIDNHGNHQVTNSNQKAGNDNDIFQEDHQVTRENGKTYQALKNCIQKINRSGKDLEWIKDAEKQLTELKKTLGIKDKSLSKKAKTLKDTEEIQLLEAQEQKRQLLTQMSEVAGLHLRNNNPAITDLSDEMRPSKLAEQFSELYDNEWTDVIECLKSTGEDNEKDMIEFLFDIVKSAYTWCKDKLSKQLQEFIQTLLFSQDNDLGRNGTDEVIYVNVNHNASIEVQQRCKGIFKKFTSNMIKDYEQEYKRKILKDILNKRGKYNDISSKQPFKEFLSKCVSLSWYMNIQDPPVEMELKQVNKLNTEHYRAYTKSGQIIDFVVWPALMLHSEGPLMYKGVAQFCNKPTTDNNKEPEADYNNEPIADYDNEQKTDYDNEPIAGYDNEQQTDYDNEPKTDYDNEPKTDYDNEPNTDYVNDPKRITTTNK